MSIDLMLKRIKVIGDYPFNKYHKLGSIYTDDEKYAVRDENGDAVVACEWEKYPYIFEILPWWSERKVEDMPEYVKSIDLDGTTVLSIDQVLYWEPERGILNDRISNGFIIPQCISLNKFVLPATKEEYEQYQSTKQ